MELSLIHIFGDLLPSEAELCRAYDISRNTVRQAIGALEVMLRLMMPMSWE